MKNKTLYIVLAIISFISGIYISNVYSEETPVKVEAPLIVDTETTCVASKCHDNMGKKKFVHGVGVNGKHCIKCHSVKEKGKHIFELPASAVEICAQCHSGKYIAPPDLEGTPPKIIASTDVFEEGQTTEFHKPFGEGKCTECHDPHESDNYLHLKGNYPEEFYAIFSLDAYALCLKCHKDFDKAMLEPRTFDLTNFRNGNLNLHYRHVNRKKGRTCKACHHPHVSEKPKLMRETFLFGMRKLNINYEKTETGGGCGPSCHVPLKYDRYEPADVMMKTTPRLGEDATYAELSQSKKKDTEKKRLENEAVKTEKSENESNENEIEENAERSER